MRLRPKQRNANELLVWKIVESIGRRAGEEGGMRVDDNAPPPRS